ncbi:hypothetical protein TNCV_4562471 [Trichonephila clavipes]|nr:hypothetical protein TNCV_4562471 [Trichonephila clavipes]
MKNIPFLSVTSGSDNGRHIRPLPDSISRKENADRVIVSLHEKERLHGRKETDSNLVCNYSTTLWNQL